MRKVVLKELIKKAEQFLGDIKGDPREQMLLMIETEMEAQAKKSVKRSNNFNLDSLMQGIMAKPYFIRGCTGHNITTTEVREIAGRVADNHFGHGIR